MFNLLKLSSGFSSKCGLRCFSSFSNRRKPKFLTFKKLPPSEQKFLFRFKSAIPGTNINDTNCEEGDSSFVEYNQAVDRRRKQASRSLLIQVHSEQSCPELYQYCQNIAPVSSLFYYSLSKNNYVLVEFSEDDCLVAALEKCEYLEANQGVPVRSPMLWFKACNKSKKESTLSPSDIPLNMGLSPPDMETINEWIAQAETIDDQMKVLYEATKLEELGCRLRFLTARQIEASLAGLFPNCKALPFGSTVNGFGKANCDLDLVLLYDDSQNTNKSRLIFQSKSSNVNGRTQTQRHMEAIADQIQLFLPGCTGVKRILQARVPIIKYTQEMAGVDCDLSMTNMSAVYMSELLWLYGEMNSSVREVVFTVKRWAQSVGLTDPSPGRWITNFSLTLLALFYLQTRGFLPPLDLLIKNARKKDVRHAEDINCTFLRDISEFKTKSTTSSSELLKGFFEFYSTEFDFSTQAISICSGRSINKPDYSALYIVNPLERSLNVSKNVSPEEVERIKVELRNALWSLENDEQGLVDLFKPSQLPRSRAPLKRLLLNTKQRRMFTIKDLFSR